MYLLEFLTNLLPERVKPYAKAVWPTIIGLAAILVSWVSTGSFSEAEVRALIATGINAFVIYAVVNQSSAVSPGGSKTV